MLCGRGHLRGVALHASRAYDPSRFVGVALTWACVALTWSWPLHGRGPYICVVFQRFGLRGPYLDERGLHELDLFTGKACNGMVY